MAASMAVLMLALMAASVGFWVATARRVHLADAPLAPYRPRRPTPCSGFDLLLVGLLAIFLEAIAQSAVQGTTNAQPGGTSIAALAAVSVSRVVWIALSLAYLLVKCRAKLEDLGVETHHLLAHVRLGCWLFVGAALPVYALQVFLTEGIGWRSKHPVVDIAQQQATLGVMLATTLIVVIVAPLAEEFYFRVMLQGWLEKKVSQSREVGHDESQSDLEAPPGVLPITISSLFFALMHYSHGPDPIPLFVLGLFFGYAYRQTHSIYAPLTIHMLVNSLGMLRLWVSFLSGEPLE
jgi:membrane protease YdiL (CAAX protease family)